MIQKLTMFFFLVMVTLLVQVAVARGTWKQALPGWEYSFPRDHAVHSEFKTEWWYFTGNLRDDGGHEFGYELTFFRQGALAPLSRDRLVEEGQKLGRFVQDDFKFAHFAVTDLDGRQFFFVQKISRGAFGEAGFAKAARPVEDEKAANLDKSLAWIEQWSLSPQPDGAWKIKAETGGEKPMSIDLRVQPLKGPVIEGTDGVSQKAEGLGNASHYYSYTRLQTSGTLSLGKSAPKRSVQGQSWFDHEWASNQLGADQVGWDWFCCQFDDGTELMLYAMRRRDGSIDTVSSGTWVDTDGRTEHLRRQDFRLQALRTWKSPTTGATYPLAWQVSIPGKQLEFTLRARLDTQELVLPPLSYWEGAIAVDGARAGRVTKGVGYMELTGYAAALKGLSGSEKPLEAGLARSTR